MDSLKASSFNPQVNTTLALDVMRNRIYTVSKLWVAVTPKRDKNCRPDSRWGLPARLIRNHPVAQLNQLAASPTTLA